MYWRRAVGPIRGATLASATGGRNSAGMEADKEINLWPINAL